MNENHALCATPEWAEFMESEVLEPVTSPALISAARWSSSAQARRRDALAPPPRRAARRARARRGRGRPACGRVRRHERHCRGRRLHAGALSRRVVRLGRLLHDAPPPADAAQQQFRTLCEAFRVLRPGRVLVGADSLASQGLHDFHEGDTYNPIDPARLLVFLQAAGFDQVMVSVGDGLLFTARKASEERSCE